MTFYSTTEVSYELQMLIDAELDPEEKLRWTGQPKPTRFVWHTLPVVLFAIPWTAFAVFWMFGAAGFKVPDFKNPESYFCLFGLPFVLIGLGMLSSPLWVMRRARRTAYALTDKRAIILVKGRSTKIRSYPAEQLSLLQKRIRQDGSGDLIFVRELSITNKGSHPTLNPCDRGFYGIAQVKEVEDILQDVIEAFQASNPEKGTT